MTEEITSDMLAGLVWDIARYAQGSDRHRGGQRVHRALGGRPREGRRSEERVVTAFETTRRDLALLRDWAGEEWRPAAGMPHHEVSNVGRVRSVGHMSYTKEGKPHGARPGRLLKLQATKDGHPVFGARVRGKRKPICVHVLMLETFVGPRPAGAVGRHLNDVPDDNRLENLAWGSCGDNTRDSVRNGRHRNAAKASCKWGHEFVERNLTKHVARRCRACHRTRAHFAGREVDEAQFQAYSDQAYAKIMERAA